MPRKARTAKKKAGLTTDKATEAQAMLRTEAILRIILDGAASWDITDYVRQEIENKNPIWPKKMMHRTMIAIYVARATVLMRESVKEGRPEAIDRHLAQRRALYARAVAAADHRTALSILDSEAKLTGLFPNPLKGLSDPDGDPEAYAVDFGGGEVTAILLGIVTRVGLATAQASEPGQEAPAGQFSPAT